MENYNTLLQNNASCNTETTTTETTEPKPEIKWNEMADSFLMIAFAVGVYSQIFSFFMYAFTV